MMMRKNPSIAAAMCVLACVALLSTPAAGQAADEELVDNPAYQSWQKHKPGTLVVYDMITAMGAFNMNMEMTQTLAEIDPEKAVVEVTTKMNMPGAPPGANPPNQKQTIKAKVPKKEAEMGKLPPGTTGEIKEAGTESVEVAGKSYECKVIEFKGKNDHGEQTGKVWNTTDIPGGVAKLNSEGQAGGQAMTIKMTVKSIETK